MIRRGFVLHISLFSPFGGDVISIIIATYSQDGVVLIADGQRSDEHGKATKIHDTKIAVLQHNLAVGYGGRSGPCDDIISIVQKSNNGRLFVESATELLLASAEWFVTHTKLPIQYVEMAFLICGASQKGDIAVAKVLCAQNKYTYKIYHAEQRFNAIFLEPKDMTDEQCKQIIEDVVAEHKNTTPQSMLEETIRRVAQQSIYVNAEFQEWTYLKRANKAVLRHSWEGLDQ